MSVLEISCVTKSFREYRSEWHRFLSWLGFSTKPVKQFEVLRDISFSAEHGEIIGIVGKNGAGKSTLLKVISGVMAPTSGRVTSTGRITAILELGMGFNPELTGRQNAVYTAGLMGFSNEDINEALMFIQEFSELGVLFDDPIRHYSSGMWARLAFSVATARIPEILIVDEALSVGDVAFQQKSFSRIKHFAEKGCTILFVSHDRNAVLSLCDRVILLDQGKIAQSGPPEATMDYYNALLAGNVDGIVQTGSSFDEVGTRSGTGEAKITGIRLLSALGEEVETIATGSKVTLEVVATTFTAIETLVFGMSIRDRLGQVIYGTNTALTAQKLQNVSAGSSVCFRTHFAANLGVRAYTIQTALVSSETHLQNNFEWIDHALSFHVMNPTDTHFVGLVSLPSSFEISYQ